MLYFSIDCTVRYLHIFVERGIIMSKKRSKGEIIAAYNKQQWFKVVKSLRQRDMDTLSDVFLMVGIDSCLKCVEKKQRDREVLLEWGLALARLACKKYPSNILFIERKFRFFVHTKQRDCPEIVETTVNLFKKVSRKLEYYGSDEMPAREQHLLAEPTPRELREIQGGTVGYLLNFEKYEILKEGFSSIYEENRDGDIVLFCFKYLGSCLPLREFLTSLVIIWDAVELWRYEKRESYDLLYRIFMGPSEIVDWIYQDSTSDHVNVRMLKLFLRLLNEFSLASEYPQELVSQVVHKAFEPLDSCLYEPFRFFCQEVLGHRDFENAHLLRDAISSVKHEVIIKPYTREQTYMAIFADYLIPELIEYGYISDMIADHLMRLCGIKDVRIRLQAVLVAIKQKNYGAALQITESLKPSDIGGHGFAFSFALAYLSRDLEATMKYARMCAENQIAFKQPFESYFRELGWKPDPVIVLKWGSSNNIEAPENLSEMRKYVKGNVGPKTIVQFVERYAHAEEELVEGFLQYLVYRARLYALAEVELQEMEISEDEAEVWFRNLIFRKRKELSKVVSKNHFRQLYELIKLLKCLFQAVTFSQKEIIDSLDLAAIAGTLSTTGWRRRVTKDVRSLFDQWAGRELSEEFETEYFATHPVLLSDPVLVTSKDQRETTAKVKFESSDQEEVVIDDQSWNLYYISSVDSRIEDATQIENDVESFIDAFGQTTFTVSGADIHRKIQYLLQHTPQQRSAFVKRIDLFDATFRVCPVGKCRIYFSFDDANWSLYFFVADKKDKRVGS